MKDAGAACTGDGRITSELEKFHCNYRDRFRTWVLFVLFLSSMQSLGA